MTYLSTIYSVFKSAYYATVVQKLYIKEVRSTHTLKNTVHCSYYLVVVQVRAMKVSLPNVTVASVV